MVQMLEANPEQRETLRELLTELEALAPNEKLTSNQLADLVNRMPPLVPEGWTSAGDIREFRGPLPDDDPDYQRNIRSR